MAGLLVGCVTFNARYNTINGVRSIPVSKHRLLKFAAGLGQAILQPATQHAVSLAAYKALAIKCAVDFSGDHLSLPAPYPNMDPTEKANISYWTGMTFAALVADDLLRVSRLLHAATFGGRIIRANPRSRSLADFVGQDQTGAWHVVEAKARQNGLSGDTVDRWKRQAKTIKSINTLAPLTRSFAFTHVGSPYLVWLVDPESSETSPGIRLQISQETIVKGYYGAMIAWLSERTAVIKRGQRRIVLRCAAYDAVDQEFVCLGMTEDAMNTAKKGELPPRLESGDFEDAYIGSDGIAVLTSPHPDFEPCGIVASSAPPEPRTRALEL